MCAVFSDIAKAARQHTPDLQHFFYASTDAIYERSIPGGIPDPIQEDTMKIAPTGQYAVTKYLGEELTPHGCYRTYGLPVTVFRFTLAVAGDEILNFSQFYLRHWISGYARKRPSRCGSRPRRIKRAAHRMTQRRKTVC